MPAPLATDRRHALARLCTIAQARRDLELQRLSSVAQSRARLLAALGALPEDTAPLDSAPPPSADAPAPVPVPARLAYLRWVEGQRRTLNQQLARVHADFLRQMPPAARAFGRARLLEDLHRKSTPGRAP